MHLFLPDHRSFFARPWYTPLRLGMTLLLLFSVVRFALVLHAARSGNYQYVSLIFLLMMVLPFVLLKKEGRQKIGIQKVKNWFAFLGAVIMGLLGSGLLYGIMLALFGNSEAHAYVYIAGSYQNLPGLMLEGERLQYFFIYSLISMSFSPLGEELFYRGLIHEYFATVLGDLRASYLDSAAFALVHLAHFGIIYQEGQWQWLVLPSLIWMTGLFLICRIFFFARQKSGSIWGAVVAHAGFNLGMNYFIFFHLLG
jgi:membrane protease YdiL (CAAX protease family)